MPPKQDRFNKTITNSIWSVLDAAVYPAVYMALLPVLMKGLGMTVFGMWIVINSLMTTLQLFNLNIGITTIKQLSAHAASRQTEKLVRTFSAILRVTLVLLGIVSLAGILIALIQPYYNFLGLGQDTGGDITACILLAALITGLKFLDQVFQSVLKALEAFRPAALLNLFNRLGLLGINVFLALQHSSVQELLVANFVFTVGYLVLHLLVLNAQVPGFRLTLKTEKRYTRSVLSFSLWPWLQSLIIVITFQTDRFWVAAFAGLETVSNYGIVATMFNHIHMIFAAMTAWALPRISGLVARGEDPSQIYGKTRNVLSATAIISLVGFDLLAPYLFPVWVGAAAYTGMAPYIKAFIAFELLFIHTVMPFFYLNAAGREREATRITLFYCLGCYGTMVAGLYLYREPVYMILGMAASLAFSMPLVNYFVQRYLTGTASVPDILKDMLPAYAAVILIFLPWTWMSAILIPLLMLGIYQYYLSSFITRKIWKLPAKL